MPPIVTVPLRTITLFCARSPEVLVRLEEARHGNYFVKFLVTNCALHRSASEGRSLLRGEVHMKSWTGNEIGLFDINFDTGERYWSFELKRMLGVRYDVPAEFHLLLQRVHPDDRRAFCKTAMQPFRGDCPRRSSIEFRVVHDDGRVHWLHMERRAIVREDDSKDVVRIVGFALEIGAPADLSRAA